MVYIPEVEKKSWLASVNWDKIGETANSVTSAADAISSAAKTIKGGSINKTVYEPSSPDTDGGLLPALIGIAALLLLK